MSTSRAVAEVAELDEVMELGDVAETEHAPTRQLDVVITLRCDLPEAAEQAGTSAIEEAAREQNRWFNGGLELDELLDRADPNSIHAVSTATPAE